MITRQLFDKTSSTYTYILASGPGHQAVIIDPVLDQVSQYMQLLEELELKLAACLDTHVHADHITASGKLRELTGCDIMMGNETQACCVTKKLHDKDELVFDGLKIKVLATPGHTDDSYSFLVNNMLFTGDTLFIRGTGRTDFQNGSAADQYNSIFNKLLTLPEDTIVYPGHDYKGMTQSTILEEKKYNPRLQVKSKEEYIELMNNLGLPNPKMMEIAVKENMYCGLPRKDK